MGTPDFAVATLKEILESKHEVVGVVTAPDRPAGRGQKLQQSAVKKFALEHQLKVLQPTNLKEEGFVETLQELAPDVMVVVAFRMLPKVVWQIPTQGTFNLHASLLPQYRGAAPINWAIINGETETGATTFFIDEKIDTGAVLLQDRIAIAPNETAGELHDDLMAMGAKLVIKTLGQIQEGTIVPQKQPETEVLKNAPKLDRDICKIDWEKPMDQIHDHIRGLSPYPSAWTTLYNGAEEIGIKVYRATKEKADHSYPTGQLKVDGKTLKIAIKEGFMELLELQLAGKRKMTSSELLNGFTPKEGAYVS